MTTSWFDLSPAARARGHRWTIVASLRGNMRPARELRRPWQTTLEDPVRGRIRLRGELGGPPKPEALVVIVHGLGGSTTSPYMRDAARAFERQGLGYLLLDLRGTRASDDIYHAGLRHDIDAALASPQLADIPALGLLGFSLGGHMALHVAHRPSDARLAAVATVCAPLALSAGVDLIDRPGAYVYRRYLLDGLNVLYERVHRRAPLPTPPSKVRRARTIREWDSLAIVPRFGFDDVEHYYSSQSVGPLLGSLEVDTLLVAAHADPMILIETLLPAIARADARLETHLSSRGGHVYFPPDLDLGLGPELGLSGQVASWFARKLAPTRNRSAPAAVAR